MKRSVGSLKKILRNQLLMVVVFLLLFNSLVILLESNQNSDTTKQLNSQQAKLDKANLALNKKYVDMSYASKQTIDMNAKIAAYKKIILAQNKIAIDVEVQKNCQIKLDTASQSSTYCRAKTEASFLDELISKYK